MVSVAEMRHRSRTCAGADPHVGTAAFVSSHVGLLAVEVVVEVWQQHALIVAGALRRELIATARLVLPAVAVEVHWRAVGADDSVLLRAGVRLDLGIAQVVVEIVCAAAVGADAPPPRLPDVPNVV